MASTKFKQFMKKYGKVALGVHLSVSSASVAGLYVAINNNVDVEHIIRKFGIGGNKRYRTAELAVSSGGVFALAVLCNKALFPIRMPITVALTPTIARFLAKRNLIRTCFVSSFLCILYPDVV
ncbi:hypothetical protein vseg_018565 [Gypsophila vaccaria]